MASVNNQDSINGLSPRNTHSEVHFEKLDARDENVEIEVGEKQKNRKTVGFSEEVKKGLEESKGEVDDDKVRSASEVAEMRVKRSTMHKEELLN